MYVLSLTVTGLAVFLLGASVFSFLNVVACRLPEGRDYVRGRSACPACGHALSPGELVPVVSYLFCGGRCRHCCGRISPRYLLVELLGGALALLCGWYCLPDFFRALVLFAFLSVLFVVAMVDQATMEIPNGFVLAMAVVAAVSYFAFPETGWLPRLIGVASVSLPLFLITLAVPEAFGGGDIKLMAAVGAFFGWKMNLVAFALAVLAGGGYGIYLLLSKRAGRKSHFAFGPFLCAGSAAAAFVGQPLLDWYLQFF